MTSNLVQSLKPSGLLSWARVLSSAFFYWRHGFIVTASALRSAEEQVDLGKGLFEPQCSRTPVEDGPRTTIRPKFAEPDRSDEDRLDVSGPASVLFIALLLPLACSVATSTLHAAPSAMQRLITDARKEEQTRGARRGEGSTHYNACRA